MYNNYELYIRSTPHPVTVTTRIITFLVGNPNLNLYLPQLLGGGTTQVIHESKNNHISYTCIYINTCLYNNYELYIRSTPHPVTVTTRIITFLVGNPNLNLYLPQLLGGGTTQVIHESKNNHISYTCIYINTCLYNNYELYIRSTPHPVTVTTRIITFLVGNPNLNLYLPQLLGGGTTQVIHESKNNHISYTCIYINTCLYNNYELYIRSTPHPVTVTTRIITFLVGNPNLNLYLPQLLGGGTTQVIHESKNNHISYTCIYINTCLYNNYELYIRSTPHPVTVTTRIITFLVGNPNLNLYLPQLLGGGTTQVIHESKNNHISYTCIYIYINTCLYNNYELYIRSTPHPVTVTTRIITFLVGNPNLNLYLPQLLGGGTTQVIHESKNNHISYTCIYIYKYMFV